MRVTYTFSGFKKIDQRGDLTIYENDLSNIQPYPDYVDLNLNPKT